MLGTRPVVLLQGNHYRILYGEGREQPYTVQGRKLNRWETVAFYRAGDPLLQRWIETYNQNNQRPQVAYGTYPRTGE